MKKMIWIGIAVLVVGLCAFQLYVTKTTNDTVKYKYETVEKVTDEVEIRQYGKAVFARVELSEGSFDQMSSRGFNVLASYIFGGNERNEKISMTSPVVMELDNTKTMEFMMPYDYNMESLPVPDNSAIEMYEKDQWRAAAIRFGGFTSDADIQKYTEKLKEVLAEKGIEHNGTFMYMGYNPPYQLINRRNEIVVGLKG